MFKILAYLIPTKDMGKLISAIEVFAARLSAAEAAQLKKAGQLADRQAALKVLEDEARKNADYANRISQNLFFPVAPRG